MLLNSYSQYYEDLIVDSILKKKIGFYVDIGANDPHHLSNTKRFYEMGWRGINIEPQANRIKDFSLIRNRDINLNFGVGLKTGILKFYDLEISSLSYFSKEAARKNCSKFNTRIKEVKKVTVRSLEDILDEYLPLGTQIDFVSVDTEGFDVEVLESNNWELYSPNVLIIEYGIQLNRIVSFLESKRYDPVFKSNANMIFKNRE